MLALGIFVCYVLLQFLAHDFCAVKERQSFSSVSLSQT